MLRVGSPERSADSDGSPLIVIVIVIVSRSRSAGGSQASGGPGAASIEHNADSQSRYGAGILAWAILEYALSPFASTAVVA